MSASPTVTILRDAPSGLAATVAIDRFVDGVAAGGIRITGYPDDDAAAADARALARAMTLKAALAGVRCGGAKTTVRADLLRDRPRALALLGEHVERMGGRLYVGPDYGFTADDRAAVASTTRFVDDEAIAERMAEATAVGVRASLAAALGSERLAGARVAIQGLGKVGAALARLLLGEGAEVAGYDPVAERVAAAGVRAVDERAIFAERWDAVCPCALGGAVDAARAETVRCAALVGAANHLLAEPADAIAGALAARGVVHVPDFLANAGALVLWAEVVLGRRALADAFATVRGIGATARAVLARAADERRTPLAVARAIAGERLAAG